MATATTKTTEKVVLELTPDEAQFIRDLLGICEAKNSLAYGIHQPVKHQGFDGNVHRFFDHRDKPIQMIKVG